jgi:hypothetical protein
MCWWRAVSAFDSAILNKLSPNGSQVAEAWDSLAWHMINLPRVGMTSKLSRRELAFLARPGVPQSQNEKAM